MTARGRFSGYSGQSYRKSRQTSVIRTRVETPTIESSGCGTTCPHTTSEAAAGELLILDGGALWGVGRMMTG